MIGLEGAKVAVTTEELKNKADALTRSINAMNNCMDSLDRIVKSTGLYWKGDAGNSYRDIYQKNKNKVEDIIKMLKDHPAELLLVAANYEDKEDRNISVNENSLMNNVIS